MFSEHNVHMAEHLPFHAGLNWRNFFNLDGVSPKNG